MMNSKILLLSIAVISVGLFAMPTTLSLFAGQHTFDKAGNTTICGKCHSDILSEIQSGGYHKSLISNASASPATSNNDCRGCHTYSRVNSSLIPRGNQSGNYTAPFYDVGLNIPLGQYQMANGSTRNYGGGVHAAVTVECVWCHTEANLTNDAHKDYASNATTATFAGAKLLLGANAACVGCHAKATVYLNWARKGGYNYTYDFLNNSGYITVNGTFVNSTTNNTG